MNQIKFLNIAISLILFGWIHLSAGDFGDIFKKVVIPIGVDAVVDGKVCGELLDCDDPLEAIKDCLLDFDKEQCATALIDPNNNANCRIVANAIVSGAREYRDYGTKYEFPDLLEQHNLYDEIYLIYEVYLQTPGFVEYVKNNVRHRRLDRDVTDSERARAYGHEIFYRIDNPTPLLIMHEMHHIWQFAAMGKKNMVENYCDEMSIYQMKPSYEFTLDPNKKFHHYGIEQQAEIIEEFYRTILAGDVVDTCANPNFLNCDDYTTPNLLSPDLFDDFLNIFDNAEPIITGTHIFDFDNVNINLWNFRSPTWFYGNGSTPSRNTGPNHSDGRFLFLEVSTHTPAFNAGYTSIIESPTIEVNHHTLSFDYHMFGINSGTLIISALEGSSVTELWRRSGQDQIDAAAPWKTVNLDLNAFHGKSIKIRVSVESAGGWRGDVSIDNFLFSIPANAVVNTTTPTVPGLIATDTYTHSDYFWQSHGGGYTSAKVLYKKGTSKVYATLSTDMMSSQCIFYGSSLTDVSGNCSDFEVFLK